MTYQRQEWGDTLLAFTVFCVLVLGSLSNLILCYILQLPFLVANPDG